MTRRQIVLQLLIEARLSDRPYLIHDHPLPDRKVWVGGGWRPVWYFVGRNKGGSAGYQRLWELQTKHGVPVEMTDRHWSYWNGEKEIRNTTPLYRLKMTPEQVRDYDWSEAWELPFKWQFNQNSDLKNNLKPVTICEEPNQQLVFA